MYYYNLKIVLTFKIFLGMYFIMILLIWISFYVSYFSSSYLCTERWWLINTSRTLLHLENSLLLYKNLLLFLLYVCFSGKCGSNKGDWICQMSVVNFIYPNILVTTLIGYVIYVVCMACRSSMSFIGSKKVHTSFTHKKL